jgi:flagellar motor switch protein FliM
MADDILSQEEVDALLRGVTGEADESVPEESAAGVRSYDIGRQERIVRGRMPTLELINERFARLLRVSLFNFTRRNTEISVGPVRVLKYSEFVRNLVVPTNLNVVQAKPLRGHALMVIEPTLVFQVIDHLFGGQGRFHSRVEGRDFTATEMRIIERLLELIFAAYGKAWEPVHELTFEHVRSEMNTQFANIATPTEVVVVVSFSIDLGGGGGDFHVCLPYGMLEPIRDVIYSSVQADRSETDSRWMSTLSMQVYGAEVELKADLASATVTLRQLLSLQPGDVIALDLPDVVTAEVDNVAVLQGRYGVVNGHYALKVEQAVMPDPNPDSRR